MSAPPAPVSFAAVAQEKKKKAELVSVQVEGQVILKIAKHCREHASGTNVVTGQLLGLDVGQTLEVTDCFPFPVCAACGRNRGVEGDVLLWNGSLIGED